VIVEDGVSLGAGCRVTSGFRVGENSIVGENTLLTPESPSTISSRRRSSTATSPGRAPGVHPDGRVVGRRPRPLRGRRVQAPAVVATHVEEETLEATQREDALRE